MRLPRFRIRTVMIAVAVVAVAITIGSEAIRLRHLSHLYRQKAIEHAQAEAAFRSLVAMAVNVGTRMEEESVLLTAQETPESKETGRTLLRVRKESAREQRAFAADRTMKAEYHAR